MTCHTSGDAVEYKQSALGNGRLKRCRFAYNSHVDACETFVFKKLQQMPHTPFSAYFLLCRNGEERTVRQIFVLYVEKSGDE